MPPQCINVKKQHFEIMEIHIDIFETILWKESFFKEDYTNKPADIPAIPDVGKPVTENYKIVN